MPLSKDQAYLAMFAFLDAYHARGRADEIGLLLGSMSLLQDGSPADPALAGDWEKAVAKALAGAVDAGFHPGEKPGRP